MMERNSSSGSFAYRARTPDGREISGTIDAVDLNEARQRLQSLQLQEIQFAVMEKTARGGALRGEDFMIFNQQLAQLAGAGLPVEQGLRMVASEMRRGSMRQTIDQVASELESGKTLPEAVARHRNQFPPLYSELIDAGIRSGNLSGILLNLGSHLTLIRRLQSMLWEALSYPVIVLIAFLGVTYFILVEMVPRWEPMLMGFQGMNFWVRTGGTYQSRDIAIPVMTQALFAVSGVVGSWPGKIVLGGLVVLGLLGWALIRFMDTDGGMAERLWMHMPLVGTVVRRNLISRWCHAVALAADAGMDLPAAMKLADDATSSPALRADGAALIEAADGGRPLSSCPTGKILPVTVVTAIETASERGDLAVTLRAYSQMYQQQAELRIGAIQAILVPVLLLIVGAVIGLLMLAMFAPLLAVLSLL